MTRPRLRRRTARAEAPAQGAPAPADGESRGRIVSPAAGAPVAGVVQVAVEPARTGRAVQLVRLEWRLGESWAVATVLDERTYEVEAPGGAAIVRSEALAQAVGALLEAEPVRSAQRPWPARPQVVLAWDTASVLPGPIVLRAVTVDEAGVEVTTDEVEVAISAAAVAGAEEEPAPPAAGPPRRLSPQARRTRTVLEAAIDSHPELDDDRREALEALLHVLLGYADPDGALPARFDRLVDEEFGDLLGGV